MPADLSGEARETGDGARTYLIASDTHLQWRDDTDELIDRIDEYGTEYDCDELVLAGDIGTWYDVETVLESGIDAGYIAGGDHDPWMNGEEREDIEDYDIGRTLAWQDDETGIRFALSHYPTDFGQTPVKDRSSETLGPYDIVIHGPLTHATGPDRRRQPRAWCWEPLP
jgi:predicted phosphodiesterase